MDNYDRILMDDDDRILMDDDDHILMDNYDHIRGRKVAIERRALVGQFTESINELGQLREVYRVWVPRGEVWGIDSTKPFLLFLTTVERLLFPIAAAPALSTVTTSRRIARVMNVADGHLDGDFQGVWDFATGARHPIVAVDDHLDIPGPGRISLASRATTLDANVAYVPFTDGQVVVSIEAPVGLSERTVAIFSASLDLLFTQNQYLHQRLASPVLLPPDFAIVVKVQANWPVAFSTGTTAGAISIPFNRISLPVIVYSELDFLVPGEAVPGETLRTVAQEVLMRAV